MSNEYEKYLSVVSVPNVEYLIFGIFHILPSDGQSHFRFSFLNRHLIRVINGSQQSSVQPYIICVNARLYEIKN